MKNELRLSINIQRHLLDLYYGLHAMESYVEMYEFIFDEEEREYDEDTHEYSLQEDEIEKIVNDYMQNLKETIDGALEFFYHRGIERTKK